MKEITTAITAVKQEIRSYDWTAQIEVQQASGMTVQKWCTENWINPKTYYITFGSSVRNVRSICISDHAPDTAKSDCGYPH